MCPVPTMDLSVNQEVMGVQDYEADYGSHVFAMQEHFRETDITGNNNFFDSLKTETSADHAQNPSPLFQVTCKDDKNLEVNNSLFSYSSFRKAMDLRIHNRTVDGGKRTIFEDAEYFSRNCCYKLLPITFEQVDEAIIHTEHNYSLFSLNSESEPDEDCSRTMDYSQIRDKNYKKRRAKYRESSDHDEVDVLATRQDAQNPLALQPLHSSDREPSFAGQPLDLSASPLVQQQKTEPLVGLPRGEAHHKNNLKENLTGIRVTITRPDEKENYQPCDMFLNDIARLVPRLIDKDCFEVDILDRTCDRRDDLRAHRLYYVIAESTWRSFQSTNERVILTNDHSLGPPVRKPAKDERPTYLIFDQFSLAKCLADYCQEIGGCFEYTCVEEGKERLEVKEGSEEVGDGRGEEESEEVEVRGEEESEEVEVRGEEESEEVEIRGEEESKEVEVRGEESGEDGRKVEIEEREVEEDEEVKLEGGKEEEEVGGDGKEMEETEKEEEKEEVERMVDVGMGVKEEEVVEEEERVCEEKATEVKEENRKMGKEMGEKAEKVEVDLPVSGKEAEVRGCNGECEKTASVKREAKAIEEKGNGTKRRKRGTAQGKNPTNSFRITTRSKSTSEVETSQKSDKEAKKEAARKRRDATLPKPEPPNKRKRPAKGPQVVTRSAEPPPEVKTERKKAQELRKEEGTQKQSRRRDTGNGRMRGKEREKEQGKREATRGVQETGRSLRPRGGTVRGEKGVCWGKGRRR